MASVFHPHWAAASLYGPPPLASPEVLAAPTRASRRCRPRSLQACLVSCPCILFSLHRPQPSEVDRRAGASLRRCMPASRWQVLRGSSAMRGRSHRCRSQSRPGEPPDAGLEAMTGGEPRGTGPSLQSGGSNSQGNARRIMAWALWGGGLLLLASASWLRNLGAAPLMDDTEPLFAEAARQIAGC